MTSYRPLKESPVSPTFHQEHGRISTVLLSSNVLDMFPLSSTARSISFRVQTAVSSVNPESKKKTLPNVGFASIPHVNPPVEASKFSCGKHDSAVKLLPFAVSEQDIVAITWFAAKDTLTSNPITLLIQLGVDRFKCISLSLDDEAACDEGEDNAAVVLSS